MSIATGLFLTVAAAEDTSNELPFNSVRHLKVITIHSPAVLPAGDWTVEVTHVRNPEAGDWGTLEGGAGDITLSAGKALSLPMGAYAGLRIKTSQAPVAAVDFKVTGLEDM